MSYAPYEPLGVPKPFGRDLWIVDGAPVDYRLARVVIPCPTRMTLARQSDGLWVHSPIEPTPGVLEAVATLGPVASIVVPNALHTAHAAAWARLHPRAVVRAATPKAASLAGVGARPVVEETTDTFHSLIVPGFEEAVFLHRPSRTLVVTDLLQTFEARRVRGRLARTLLQLGGATGPGAGPSVEVRLALLRHPIAVRRAVRRMIEWAPERIVLAHGPCIERDAMVALQLALPH